MKKVSDEVVATQIRETLISIHADRVNGKLKVGEQAHPFHRVEQIPQAGMALSDQDIANLLTARLKAQGYVVFFDAELARQVLDQAMARLGGLLRPPT
ncbi:hypothetical protein [Nocardia phage NC1]|nr:hypothetical protein [Nocardia phage NC1]QSL67721.1 hypothetical protein [Nocardia phage P69]